MATMTFLKHFHTPIDYEKLIKIQAIQTAPYSKAVNINKNVMSGHKVKTIGKKGNQGGIRRGKC